MMNVQTEQLCDTIDALKQAAAVALNDESPDEFELFEKQLNHFDAALRETQQEMWSQDVQTAIDHLEGGGSLTETDVEAIRTFLVSDAEHYLAVENNYHDWLEELQRLMDDMAHRAERLDRVSVGELRGVVKDAIRLVPDIRNYLDERRRIEKFNLALHTYDSTSRSMLARVLKEQLRTSNR